MQSILVVDDEPTIALSVERSLRNKYQVRVAHTATEAMKICRRSRPDLMILDVMMPGINGFDFCRQLRENSMFKSMPVLFLTALTRQDEKHEGFEVGADDYLTKPFDIKELQFRVTAILRRVQGNVAVDDNKEFVTVGELSLNCQNYQLTVKDKNVLLTPVEFDLMHHLMSHPNEVFSGERLLRELWDYPSDTGSTDLVRMHVRNVRRKIEEDTRKPRYILTVPRHGYTVSTT